MALQRGSGVVAGGADLNLHPVARQIDRRRHDPQARQAEFDHALPMLRPGRAAVRGAAAGMILAADFPLHRPARPQLALPLHALLFECRQLQGDHLCGGRIDACQATGGCGRRQRRCIEILLQIASGFQHRGRQVRRQRGIGGAWRAGGRAGPAGLRLRFAQQVRHRPFAVGPLLYVGFVEQAAVGECVVQGRCQLRCTDPGSRGQWCLAHQSSCGAFLPRRVEQCADQAPGIRQGGGRRAVFRPKLPLRRLRCGIRQIKRLCDAGARRQVGARRTAACGAFGQYPGRLRIEAEGRARFGRQQRQSQAVADLAARRQRQPRRRIGNAHQKRAVVES